MNPKKYNTPISPAQLWVGNHDQLIREVQKRLQNIFCAQEGCETCVICKQIEKQQHHSCMWIKPTKKYTLDQIAIIFDTIAFKLEPDQNVFFILQHADFLTDTCANKLLKSVEEPPTGYHFIFLAQRLSQILPTIQSRCIIKNFYAGQKTVCGTPLMNIFKSDTDYPPSQFLKILDEEKPNEKESMEMVDQLLSHWIQVSKSSIDNKQMDNYRAAQAKITIIKAALETPAMPGSSKIFWRNFYLQFKQQ